MTDTGDPHQLNRFIRAQDARGGWSRTSSYEQALSEIEAGCKVGHWMWYIFPQFEGLGSSETSRAYAIKSTAEAEAYLGHPVLGPRLTECMKAALDAKWGCAIEVFGPTDAKKLRSCATLFAWVSPLAGSVFHKSLDMHFAGKPDGKTLHLLGVAPDEWSKRMAAPAIKADSSPSNAR